MEAGSPEVSGWTGSNDVLAQGRENSASFLHKVVSKTYTQIHIYIYFEKGEGFSSKQLQLIFTSHISRGRG
ncbi:hypothetical protein LB504_002462 [Fusarium proliferatum]|nr:hypothetical protein LB504_002462 [Fusarium proliferatum]